jgi:hypothetical protein
VCENVKNSYLGLKNDCRSQCRWICINQVGEARKQEKVSSVFFASPSLLLGMHNIYIAAFP